MTASLITDARVVEVLRSTFGYTSFRPLQAEIVASILNGQDVFVLMPTGGGKSLCYQLPALLLDRLTVVVSPLIALMKDQVDKLRAAGVAATYINSSLDADEIGRRQGAVARGEVKLLYVAPERLLLPGFLHLLSSAGVAFFAIDEAHCISEWGHDFRPEYREIKRLRGLFPSAILGTFTATATRRVQADIKTHLGLQNAVAFCGSFNRPNLYYEVRPKQEAYEQLAAYLRGRGQASGIIYCQSRAGTERLASRLQKDGFSATAYHAGLASNERRQRQEAFVKDDVQIIVATIAFGMGIDKPDVRFVVHFDLPKTLEGYYQESGRAGRDGEPSDCIMFYSYADAAKHRHFIDEKPSENERQIALWQLQQVINWATGTTCRRSALIGYFDEQPRQQPDPCCDVCRTPLQEEDYTIPAQMLLSCVKRTGERFGIMHLIDVLRGSRGERVRRYGHDKLSTYGIGRDRSKEEWRFLANELLRRGHISQDGDEFKTVKVTELGRAVLFKGEKVILAKAPAIPSHPVEPDTPHQVLFDRLRTLRKRMADERGVPPYVIFHDATLRQMAAELPTSRQHLLRLYGVGQRKALDFGDAFLAHIEQYVRETGAQPESLPISSNQQQGSLSSTVRATLDIFNTGRSVVEVAAARKLAVSTIEGHLAEAMEAGETVSLDRLVSDDKRRAIEAAMAEHGTALLKPIMESLGDGYTYAELRFVRAKIERSRSS
ncbi:MAG: DNA helicase RecQ [Chloroflexi bacterium]|nr:DNA helicase RecQ [Chloroflexota bacterium]